MKTLPCLIRIDIDIDDDIVIAGSCDVIVDILWGRYIVFIIESNCWLLLYCDDDDVVIVN